MTKQQKVESEHEIGPVRGATGSETRERILDVALDLFTEQGYDGTSLREIAERLGVTKAALYYHFESKLDILMALHMRLHQCGRDALANVGGGPVTLEIWGDLVRELLAQMLVHRKIFLLHERNQAVLEKLHTADHEADHDDVQNQFRSLLADDRVPLADRVRMAASFGTVFSVLFLSGESFSETPDATIEALVLGVLKDVLRD